MKRVLVNHRKGAKEINRECAEPVIEFLKFNGAFALRNLQRLHLAALFHPHVNLVADGSQFAGLRIAAGVLHSWL